ncbi:MAG: QueT transporter family protein [Limnochordales bacterium]|nr:QueT transporter family protein [Limnochordales bacterium]
MIAAAYVVLVFAFAFASFGPIQLRVAEALTVMPLFYPEAIPGLWIGCMLANILGGYGPWDIFAGSAITGLAAILTWLLRRRRLLALAAPVVLNAFLVSLYLAPLILHVPYWPTVLTVGIGEALAVYGLGWPLARWWERQMTSGSSLSRWLK